MDIPYRAMLFGCLIEKSYHKIGFCEAKGFIHFAFCILHFAFSSSPTNPNLNISQPPIMGNRKGDSTILHANPPSVLIDPSRVRGNIRSPIHSDGGSVLSGEREDTQEKSARRERVRAEDPYHMKGFNRYPRWLTPMIRLRPLRMDALRLIRPTSTET